MAHAHAQGQGIERGAGPGGPDALAARRAGNRRRMLVAAAINAALIAAGVIGGVLTGSLALLADAGHVLSDLAAIGLAVLAGVLAARPGGPRRTFGYQRSEVIAALLNGVTLVAIAVLIVVAAVNRLGDPPEVEGAGVLILGVVGAGRKRGSHLGARRGSAGRHQPGGGPPSLGRGRARLARGDRLRRGDPDHRLEADRPVGQHRDRGADPRLVGSARSRAARRPDGSRAPGR